MNDQVIEGGCSFGKTESDRRWTKLMPEIPPGYHRRAMLNLCSTAYRPPLLWAENITLRIKQMNERRNTPDQRRVYGRAQR